MICGDPKQLGPVITLDISKDITDKFMSPLARYMEMDMYKDQLNLCVQLKECFRCQKVVVDIVSSLFYENKLVAVTRQIVKKVS